MLNSHSKYFQVFYCCLLIFSACLFSTASRAGELHSIHIEWAYDVPSDFFLEGFYLYKNDAVICETEKAEDRAMNCIFESEPGTFNFYLSAYSDSSESPLSAPFPFTINEIIPPVIDISTDSSTGTLPLTVTLYAEPSQGSVTRYQWSFGDGTQSIWTNQNQVTHTFYIAGQYTATVTARDLNNNRDTKNLVINVDPQEVPQGATPPTASIRSSVTSGSGPFTVSFDGLASFAENGEISQCIWNFDDNSQLAWGATATHTYSIPGTYNPKLTVIDSQGVVHTSSVTVVVSEPSQSNIRPEAKFTCNLVEKNESLVLDFDASSSNDSDGQIENFVWNFGTSAFETGPQVTHTFPVNKVTSISLTVTDSSGLQHSRTINTITFLKEIHGAVIYQINSLLLHNDGS